VFHRVDVRLLACLLALLFLPLAVQPARGGDRPYTVGAMLRMAAPQEVRLSADGRRVAFTVVGVHSGKDGEVTDSRILVADLATGTVKPVTPIQEQCEKPHFSPDGSQVAYLVDGDDGANAAVVRLATGQSRRLTRGTADVLDLAFAPDGKTLAATMTVQPQSGQCPPGAPGSDVEVYGGPIGVSSGLYLLSTERSGPTRPLVTDRDVGEFVFSPDAGRIAFETTSPDTPARGRQRRSPSEETLPQDAAQVDIAVVDTRTRAVTLVAASEASETTPRFSPDGKWLAYVATAAPGFYFNAARVMVVPASGGPSRALAETPDARPELLGWSSRGDAVYVREASGTGAVLWALPVDGSPARPFSDTPHMVSQACLSPGGDALGLVIEDSDMPPEVWVTPAERFAPQPVSAVNREFAAYRLARTEVVRWTSKDGTALEGLYTHPVHPVAGPPPLLVEIHGGPALVADRQCLGSLNYYPLAVFAERGYAIFRPNVRGSDGYGPAFRMANRGDWGGGDFQDLESGIDALVARGLADPARLGIMGWSYGGYLAAWAVGHTDRFKAASVGAGITNLVSQAGSMDLPDFIPLYFGGEVWQRFDVLFDRSPLKYAAAITTPTLFQHGEADDRVPFSQSLELFTALSRRGVPTCLAAYPRSGHDVTEPPLLRDLMSRNLDWFAHFLPATPPPAVRTAKLSPIRP
jgi:dipeptidyl aminopeptidase/acylaminoacyl peptidase